MPHRQTQTEGGEIALSLVDSLSDIACCIFSSNQEKIRCRVKYIGIRSGNILLVESPIIKDEAMRLGIQTGYHVKACALSPHGEGAKIFFRTKIRHIVELGNRRLLLLSLPKKAKVKHGIRTEARLDTVLRGVIAPNDEAVACEIHDYSAQGCLFFVSIDDQVYQKDDTIVIQIFDELAPGELHLLKGSIKNTSRSNQHRKYGVKFLPESYDVALILLSRMSFDVARYHFMLSPLLSESEEP